jgi:hypothetical protein
MGAPAAAAFPSARDGRLRAAALVLGLVAPPLLLLGWMFGDRTIGNDYQKVQIWETQSFRYYATEGLEPMWYPHLTGGVPIGAISLAQVFHWPAWLTSLSRGFWTGDALRPITARELLLFALAHAVYGLAIRSLVGLSPFAAYLVGFVCVYNARNLDSLRYGPALDATVYGHAAILLGAVHVVRPSWWRLVGLAVVGQLLFTSGYLVGLPFAALAAVVLLAAVFGRSCLEPGIALRRLGEVAGAALVGFLLAAPNWLPFTEWLDVNYTRITAPTLAWASQFALPPASVLANLVYPWAADAPSSFGGCTLLPLLLVTVVIGASRPLRRGWPVLFALAFPFTYALGALSPVFLLFFRYVPGFASIRAPGRALYMLPLLLVAGGAWLARSREGKGGDGDRVGFEATLAVARRWSGWLNLAVCAVAVLLVVLVPGHVLGGHAAERFSPAVLTGAWPAWKRVLWLGLGVVAALTFALRVRSRAGPPLLLGATLGQTLLVFHAGTWMEARHETPPLERFRMANHLPLYGESPFFASNTVLENTAGSATVAYTLYYRTASARESCVLPTGPRRPEGGILLPFYLSPNVVCVRDRAEALARLDREACPAQAPVRTLVEDEACAGLSSPPASLLDLAALNEKNVIEALTPNLVSVRVESDRPAVLVTPFPSATRNWTGWLDGQEAPLLAINGGFLGVKVPPGPHTVGVRYFSERTLRAYRIFFGTLLLAALALLAVARTVRYGSDDRHRTARLATAALGLMLATGVGIAYTRWERGLRDRAWKPLVLTHDYPELLRIQAQRWRDSASSVARRR